MTAMALGPTFYDFGEVAERHVKKARPRVALARRLSGHLLDRMIAFVLRGVNRGLDRDVVRMRGLRASLEHADPQQVLDSKSDGHRWLKLLEKKVLELQGEALKAKAKCHPSEKSHPEICRTAELCGQLHEAVVELRIALTEHDSRAMAALTGAGTLVFELTARQAEQLEECTKSEREPTAKMREAGRRYKALVTSR